ncbi:MAG: glycosyltransferase [Bacteroidales bacterium]|nr:glycosyltransferase [Bacteroidales bacterium]
MKIAFIHNNFPAGGAERVTIDVARYLSSFEGYNIYVYASRIAEGLMTDDIRQTLVLRKIPTQAIPSKRAKAIEKYILEDGIDVLVQVTKSISGIEKIKENTGVKTVVACHGEPFWQRYAIVYRRQKGWVRKLMWTLYNKKRYEDGTLAMRKAIERTRRDYESCNAYTVLCNAYKPETAKGLGIDPDHSHIYPIENPEYPVASVNYDKEKMILFCGRFENWSKRIDRLLRIWLKVQDKLTDWRLVLVGNGEDWDRLNQLARKLGLQRISFEGRRNNVADYYNKASIVALTSETEGWGLALTEAQAHGCICIAFGCTSGIREVLSPDGECGFIVPPFDEDAYAETLLRLTSLSEEQQLAIRKQAVARRLEYRPEVIAEKWKILFDDLMKQ